MRRILLSGSIIAGLLLGGACKEKTESKVLTKEVTFTKEGELYLKKAKNDSLLANLSIEIADDDYQRETGLMYRKSMQDDQGMLFIFKEEAMLSFYMKNTEFSIDIIYINGDKKIVNIAKNAEPFNENSLPSEGVAKYVLEVNAGLTDTWKLEKGDKVEWND